jgi:hypothetical protein
MPTSATRIWTGPHNYEALASDRPSVRGFFFDRTPLTRIARLPTEPLWATYSAKRYGPWLGRMLIHRPRPDRQG